MTSHTDILRAEISALHAYHVPPAQGFLKLDAMENPYDLPPELQAELGRRLAQAPINRYPDPQGSGIKAGLKTAMGIPDGFDVLLGNGSDEIIQLLAMLVMKPGATLLSVEPSFVMYKMIATFCGINYVGVPLNPADFSLDLDAMLAAVREHQPALVFLAYPNNPTGNAFDAAAIEAIIEAAPGLVVVDEAYHAFAEDSFFSRLQRYPNLLVMRTLSKLGVAGLRLGFIVGAPGWITELDKLRLPYNINVLTQIATELALEHVDVLNGQAAVLKQERTNLLAALNALPGVTAFPSQANFILARVPDALAVFNALKEKKILIKNLHGGPKVLDNCLRFTVGRPEDNAVVVAALKEIIK
ncbi:histidinol phosphate aminotransferase apoenzyme [Andreprevotia lacus DSM 23236]|jgi:histidinol-phosphate aminotransferase|uniref:Histidinol-phosphate aminotransferase n=1 Tax=Andreprevotia lacus DSM 23236 TaxID=1121001 RepID=A0A1W1XSX5_9NEIS|nr:histidinol-phosphate transaminase [Andreprevotia lacus]SMC27069.1 histidinol phosphate aminotransferase apoenzyme [Andreprevotia lacus DSM 23236]